MSAAPATERDRRDVAILEAACRVVLREGAHGLRMASVAREAGVSKALVHYYFPTRQDLLRKAFAFSEERWNEAIADARAPVADGASQLEIVLLSGLESGPPFGDHRALWNEVWSSLRFDDELRPGVEASYRTWIDLVVALVRQGRDDGSISASVDADAAGWRLAAMADGFDSLLYLGLVDRERARTLMREGIARELAG